MTNVARGRPPLANKPPVLAKFPKATEDGNANITDKPVAKWGTGAALNIKQDELNAIKNSLNKGSAAHASEVNHSHEKQADPVEFRKVALKPPDCRRVSVPKVFQADEAQDTESPAKFPLKPATKIPIVPNKTPVPLKLPNAVKEEDKLSETAQQPVTPAVKTWGAKAAATVPADVSTSVTKTWGNKTGVTPVATSVSPNTQAAATSVARNWGNKPVQTSSTTTSHVSSPPTPVKPWNVKTSTLSATTTPAMPSTPTLAQSQSPSPPDHPSENTEEENEKGKFDFRKQMKQRNSISSSGQLIKTSDDQRSPMTDITPKNTEKVKSHTISSTQDSDSKMSFSKQLEVSLRSPGKKPVALQEKKRQSSNIIIERKSDHKKFKKVKLSTLPPETAVPAAKPALPTGIDLTQIKVDYQKKIQDMQHEADEANAMVDNEEIYDDGCSATSPVLPRRPTFKSNSERISMIPDMAPEEEGDFYDDGISQPIVADDIYADGESERKEEIECDDIYEDEESFSKPVETEEEKKKRLKEEAEAKKREEKERKEREKQEKEQKKKEEKEKKERLKLIKKLNMTGNEANVGEGTIKQDAKGSGLNLTVKKGQMVTILRLNENPANKWLVKIDENTMGYVDSKNIEIDPNIIRMAMVNVRKNSKVPDDDDQPTYDDVPPDGAAVVDEIEEEIYEEL